MECQVGDVDGDGDDVAIRFDRDAVPGSTGRVYAALNDGLRFSTPLLWHMGFCSGNDQCHVGDVTGDGKVDLIAFPKTASNRGVYVAPSTGTSFGSASLWSGAICDPSDDCRIGDFNSCRVGRANTDTKMDAFSFINDTPKSTDPADPLRGDAQVTKSQ